VIQTLWKQAVIAEGPLIHDDAGGLRAEREISHQLGRKNAGVGELGRQIDSRSGRVMKAP
jgi:hypothetical protein